MWACANVCLSLGWLCGQAGLHGACPAPERARADRGVVQQAGATATHTPSISRPYLGVVFGGCLVCWMLMLRVLSCVVYR